MKAHIPKARERVLTYILDDTTAATLSLILEKMSVEEYRVPANKLGQKVGVLAGYTGFEGTQCEDGFSVGESMLCMCGLSSGRVNQLLEQLRENHIDIPLKAVVTATNQNWSFARLAEALQEERKALAQKNARPNKP